MRRNRYSIKNNRLADIYKAVLRCSGRDLQNTADAPFPTRTGVATRWRGDDG